MSIIKYNNKTINKLEYNTSEVNKMYYNSDVCYGGDGGSPEPPTPPTPSFNGKWLATYTGSTTSSAECDASSAITQNEISKSGLTSVEIGNCVTELSLYAFSGYDTLTSVTIPNSVTSIGDSTFWNCTSLTSITIPNSVTSIDKFAFASCTSLTSVTVLATIPPTLGGNAFYHTTCPIYVPAASVSAYQSTWSAYASRIQAIP